jgi:hypothetical protein
MNVNVPTELHSQFKAAAAAQGLEMTVVLLAFFQKYVVKYGTVAAKKGRRAWNAPSYR